MVQTHKYCNTTIHKLRGLTKPATSLYNFRSLKNKNRQTGSVITLFPISNSVKYNTCFSPLLKSCREGSVDRNSISQSHRVFMSIRSKRILGLLGRNLWMNFNGALEKFFIQIQKKFSPSTLLILLRIHFIMRTQGSGTAIPLMLLPEALPEEEVSCSLALRFLRYEILSQHFHSNISTCLTLYTTKLMADSPVTKIIHCILQPI